jgi:CDP-diacylglycerol--glycerol-3-phosphate 3-phosphatidyltransferase
MKYHRFSNYHTYSAKAWGIMILISLIFLFGFGHVGLTIWLAALAGVICSLEEIAITFTLSQWTYDVPSIFHALKMNKIGKLSQFPSD